MKSIQTTLQSLYQQLNSVSESLDVYHYEKSEDADVPYIVWAEDGEESSFHSDNGKHEQVIGGVVDYYTQTEFDSNVDTIQTKLNELSGCSWLLDSVQYEDDTKLIHYHWRWEMI